MLYPTTTFYPPVFFDFYHLAQLGCFRQTPSERKHFAEGKLRAFGSLWTWKNYWIGALRKYIQLPPITSYMQTCRHRIPRYSPSSVTRKSSQLGPSYFKSRTCTCKIVHTLVVIYLVSSYIRTRFCMRTRT